jgi:hypothetical protein
MRATTCGQWYGKSRAGHRTGPHIEDGSSVRNLVGLAQRSKLLAAMDPTVVQIKSQNREVASGEPSYGDTLSDLGGAFSTPNWRFRWLYVAEY